MKVLNPTVKANQDAGGLAPRLGSLAGSRVGLLDNGKKGTALIFDNLERILKREFGVLEVIRERKPDFSRPAPSDVLAKLTKADTVISGVGD